MKGEHDLGLEKLLNHKVFEIINFSTLITFSLGACYQPFMVFGLILMILRINMRQKLNMKLIIEVTFKIL